MEEAGEDGTGHIVLNRRIGEVCGKTFAVVSRALAIAWFAVFSLADTSQKGVPGDLDVVKRTASNDLLSDGEGRDIFGLHRQEIR